MALGDIGRRTFRFAGRQARRGAEAIGLKRSRRDRRLDSERDRQQREAEERARRRDQQAAALNQAQRQAPQIGALGQGAATPVAPGRGELSRSVPTVPGARAPGPPDLLSGAGADVRERQTGLNQAILDRALGRGGASPAELQAQQALERNIATQQSLAAANRGSSVGGAQRIAAGNIAALNAQAAQDAAILRAEEQVAAQGLATQALQGQRGQDIRAAVANAQIGTQRDIANLNAQLRQQGLNLQERMFLIRTAMAERGFSADQIDKALIVEMQRQQQRAGLARDVIKGATDAAAAAATGGAGGVPLG